MRGKMRNKLKKIRVKPIFGAHQIYQEIVNYPPKSVEYLGVSGETKKGNYYQNKKWKEGVGKFLQRFNIPRMIPIKSRDSFDLIHSSRGIIPLQFGKKKPWVMDIEHVHSFFGLDPNPLKRRFWKKRIEKIIKGEECKGILCHCEATRKAFFHYLDLKGFENKIKLLYPASHLFKIKKDKHQGVRILCVLSDFKCKAGEEVLESFSRLAEKEKNVELWIKADVPDELKKKYSDFNIKFIPYHGQIVPREQLIKDLHAKCDIFLYPTLTDSFGYSLVDAMIAKMPIIGTNLFAVPEMVEDGKNGFVVKIPGYKLEEGFVQSFPSEKMNGTVKEKFIESVVEVLKKLVKDKKLREKMGQESYKKVSSGNFSIKNRNKKLREIYEEALNEDSANK